MFYNTFRKQYLCPLAYVLPNRFYSWCQSITEWMLQNLAKLFHNIAASTSILCDPEPAGALNWHQLLLPVHALDKSQQRQVEAPVMTSPVPLMINSLSCFPILPLLNFLDKTSVELIKTPAFWIDQSDLNSGTPAAPNPWILPCCLHSFCTLSWSLHVTPWSLPCVPWY